MMIKKKNQSSILQALWGVSSGFPYQVINNAETSPFPDIVEDYKYIFLKLIGEIITIFLHVSLIK